MLAPASRGLRPGKLARPRAARLPDTTRRLYHVRGEGEVRGLPGPRGAREVIEESRWVAVAGHARVVVHERPVRVGPPRPHVQRVEGRDAVAVGGRVEVEELAHQRGRRLVGRVPRGRDHDVLHAHQLELAPLRLVDQGLGTRGVDLAVADQLAVDVVDAHRPARRAADAAEEERVAGGGGRRDVLVAIRRPAHLLGERRRRGFVVHAARRARDEKDCRESDQHAARCVHWRLLGLSGRSRGRARAPR